MQIYNIFVYFNIRNKYYIKRFIRYFTMFFFFGTEKINSFSQIIRENSCIRGKKIILIHNYYPIFAKALVVGSFFAFLQMQEQYKL